MFAADQHFSFTSLSKTFDKKGFIRFIHFLVIKIPSFRLTDVKTKRNKAICVRILIQRENNEFCFKEIRIIKDILFYLSSAIIIKFSVRGLKAIFW